MTLRRGDTTATTTTVPHQFPNPRSSLPHCPKPLLTRPAPFPLQPSPNPNIDANSPHLSSPTGTYLEDAATNAAMHDNMDEDCTSCPASTYGPTTSATSIAACIGCPSGKASAERSEACFQCGE